MRNLLELDVPKEYEANAGQLTLNNPIGIAIGVLITIIMTVAVAIPITQDLINATADPRNNATYTYNPINGTTATIIGFLPVMLGIFALIAIVMAFS